MPDRGPAIASVMSHMSDNNVVMDDKDKYYDRDYAVFEKQQRDLDI